MNDSDRYCGTSHPSLKKESCEHLVVKSKRYLVWPDLLKCCFCCDDSHGCGIMKPDWAITNSKYLGIENCGSKKCNRW